MKHFQVLQAAYSLKYPPMHNQLKILIPKPHRKLSSTFEDQNLFTRVFYDTIFGIVFFIL